MPLKTVVFALFALLLPAAPLPGAPLAVAAPGIAARSETPAASVVPDAAERKNLASEWRRWRDWAHREAESLRDLLSGYLGILLAVLVGLWGVRKLRHNRSFPKRISWRREFALALAEPMLLLAALGGGFLFLLPLLRALPAHHPLAGKLFQLLGTLCAAWGGNASDRSAEPPHDAVCGTARRHQP